MIDDRLAQVAARPGIEVRQVLFRRDPDRWQLGLLVEEQAGTAIVAQPLVEAAFDATAMGPAADVYSVDLTAVPWPSVVPFNPPSPEVSDMVRAVDEAAHADGTVQESLAQRIADGLAYIDRLPTRATELEPLLAQRGNSVRSLAESFQAPAGR